MTEQVSDVWNIRVNSNSTKRVVFRDDIDEAEARKQFMNGSYEDVIDETDEDINEIVELEAI